MKAPIIVDLNIVPKTPEGYFEYRAGRMQQIEYDHVEQDWCRTDESTVVRMGNPVLV